MTMQQEARIRKLETLLQKTEKFLTIIAAENFIHGEKYCECFFCGHDVEDEHLDTCLALEALEVRLAIERTLVKHKVQSGA